MIFEMNPAKTERLFIVPKIREVLFEARDKGITSSFVETARHLSLEGVIYAERQPKNELTMQNAIQNVGGNDIQRFVDLIRKLYPLPFKQTGAELAACVEKDQKILQAILKRVSYQNRRSRELLFGVDAKSQLSPPSSVLVLNINEISQTGFAEYWCSAWEKLEHLREMIERRLEVTQSSIEEIMEV